jgi:ketosteroid isomerase-like protein
MCSVVRFIVFTGCIIGAAAPIARAQSAPGDRAELLRLEDGWAKALVKRDKAYFTKTLAPGFVYTEDDKVSSREELLSGIVTPADTVTSARNEDMVVHLFGSAAAVTGLLVVDGRANGTPYHHRYRFTDTWQKQKDGRWRIVAAQDYLIPATKR